MTTRTLVLPTRAGHAERHGVRIGDILTLDECATIMGLSRHEFDRYVYPTMPILDGGFVLRTVVREWIQMHASREIEPDQNPNAVVYFIEAVGLRRVKIGFTVLPVAQRVRALQTGCPVPLRLIGTICGGYALERLMHERFDGSRAMPGSEWFHLTDDIVRIARGGRW